jgi:hypothetical protein
MENKELCQKVADSVESFKMDMISKVSEDDEEDLFVKKE